MTNYLVSARRKLEDKIFNIWLAGFWEGEGSVSKFKNKNCYRITLAQTIKEDREVELCFKMIKEKFGGNYYKIKPTPKNKQSNTLLRYHLDQRDDVINFIKTIYPYCQFRKNEIENAFKYFELHPRKRDNFHSKTKNQQTLKVP